MDFLKKQIIELLFLIKSSLLKLHFFNNKNNLESEFAIDVVYTWVNDSDISWAKKKNFYKSLSTEKKQLESSSIPNRYKNRNELLFSMRSINMYAPWVRKIFIVTDDQTPEWLKTSEKIQVISHKDIFPDESVLPVFNSHAIESCLHRIKGLSENFLYFNDDVFLSKKTVITDFFTEELKKTKFFYSTYTFIPDLLTPTSLPVDISARNNMEILTKFYGISSNKKFKHTPIALKKSILNEIETLHPDIFDVTRRNKFRSENDYSIVSSFYHHFTLFFEKSEASEISYNYIKLVGENSLFRMKTVFLKSPHTFCLNDIGDEEPLSDEFTHKFNKLLYKMYPKKANWEI